MKKRYVKRAILCIVLTLALCISAIAPQMHSYAVDPIIPDTKCSLTVEMAESHQEQFSDLVSETAKEVYLFKVADVDKYAQFTVTDQFKGNEELSNLIAGIYGNGETYKDPTSSQWEKMAELASGVVGIPYLSAENEKLDETEAVTPADDTYTEKGVISEGQSSVQFTGLDTGLYLVYIRKALTTRHVYSFQPYLVALPNNEWYGDQDGDAGTNDDSWTYDVRSVMKPKQDIRYGEIEIRKTVNRYNEAMGEAIFAFRVTARLDGEIVYDDVIALDFANGIFTGTAKNIPAGSTVTIGEEYGGAAYELKGPGDSSFGGDKWNGEAWEVELLPKEGDDENLNGYIQGGYVGFVNDNNNSAGWSTGVQNHYEKTGEGWDYSKPNASEETDNQ